MQTLLLLSAFVALASVGLAIVFEIAVARTGRVQPLDENNIDDVLTKLSVVIPARNEEEDIEKALRSVLSQRGVDLQVIVVNDHSTDKTGVIVRRLADEDARITLIENPPLDRGWLGKPNAMNHAVGVASADLILFTDADIVHAPTAFATGLSVMRQENLDFLSLTPLIVCESFWENVFIPLSLVPFTAQSASGGVNNPKSSEAWAAGAFMLIKRGVLQEIGGIESIKSQILDDTELARVVKRNGHRVGYHLAPDLMRVRMFKGNSHAFWGPTKNAIALTFSYPWMSIPAMGLPVLVFWVPIVAVLVGIWSGDIRLFAVGLLQPLIGMFSLFRVRSLCRFQWHKAVFFPLVVIPIVCVLARAFYQQNIRGTHVWRDRTIDLKDTEPDNA